MNQNLCQLEILEAVADDRNFKEHLLEEALKELKERINES